ncbi:MATE family efflux transporter, partial [Candidatus Babeliales bacterium]|nr:MATE family efflux transporter [Candidatus Babeliales bacterium]
LHMLTKFAEAIPVASVAIIGRHNGAKDYHACGRHLGDTFWTTCIIGLVQCIIIYTAAVPIFQWLGGSEKMIAIGAPFLKLRSISVLLSFIFMAFLGFMRGVKNTTVPMYLNLCGIIIFMISDYVLILGKFGFPRLGLTGSAIASIIQYSTMIVGALWFITKEGTFSRYFPRPFFYFFNIKDSWRLLTLSVPIIIDKVSLAVSYVWLAKQLAPMGKYIISSYDVIVKLERFAFLPAIAFAQVITFLVSNKLGEKNPDGAKEDIKKVMILSTFMISFTLIILCLNRHWFIGWLDPKNRFTDFTADALPFISILVIFDFIQLILAGALRGAGDVKTVMYTRFFSCFFFFFPLAYFFGNVLVIQDELIKFILIYSSFYLNTALMGLVFLYRIKSKKWISIPL